MKTTISVASNTDRDYNISMRDKSNWNLVEFKCLNCGTSIKAFPSRHRKYCETCSKNRQIKVKCAYCSKEVSKHPSRQAKYCSRSCWHNAQFGKTYRPEFGKKVSKTKLSKPVTNDAAGRKRSNTYLYPIAEPCEECGTTEKIDRHHIDKNPRNNERSNIAFLCKLHHQRLHRNWLDRWSKR